MMLSLRTIVCKLTKEQKTAATKNHSTKNNLQKRNTLSEHMKVKQQELIRANQNNLTLMKALNKI